jgi:hypothetical protein
VQQGFLGLKNLFEKEVKILRRFIFVESRLTIIIGMAMLLLGTNLYARSPDISVTPASLSDGLFHGEISKQWILISNYGVRDLSFDISIEGGDSIYVLEFDGVDDYAEVPDHPSLSAIGGAFTVEYWMNVGEYPFQSREILGKWGPGGSSDDEYDMDFLRTGRIRMSISGSTGGYAAIQSNPISPYTWTHVAGVFDSTSASLKLFINGTLEANITPSTVRLDRDTDRHFRMGTYDFYFYSNFKGQLDEVRVWNVARTQAEIQANIPRELRGTEPGLVGYWKFDEGSGDTAYDSSPNNNDGILHGGVTWIASPSPVTWLSIKPTSNTVAAGSSVHIEVTFDTRSLNSGDYDADIVISSNDPDEPKAIIPVHLTVMKTFIE